MTTAAVQHVSVIVPTFNEAPNVAELVARVSATVADLDGISVEIIFVDDSTDETPLVIEAVAAQASLPVRLIRREEPVGRLGGAVVEGIRAASGDWSVVMDGDLQHPPEMIPVLLAAGRTQGADVVVASRYCGDGSASGLAGGVRRLVSSGSTLLTRAMFPRRLKDCTDPMTGFFALRRDAVHLGDLHPRGFKILLEVLARQPLKVVEEPFIFGERKAGESKAGLAEGMRFLRQLIGLRLGRMSQFALVGLVGTVLNLALMAVFLAAGVHYLPAAIVATEATILTNFAMSEWWVFGDLRQEGRSWFVRFVQFFSFNNAEALVRLPLLLLLVEVLAVPSLLAQALTLALGFLARFVFVSRVVYRPRRRRSPTLDATDTLPSGLATR